MWQQQHINNKLRVTLNAGVKLCMDEIVFKSLSTTGTQSSIKETARLERGNAGGIYLPEFNAPVLSQLFCLCS